MLENHLWGATGVIDRTADAAFRNDFLYASAIFVWSTSENYHLASEGLEPGLGAASVGVNKFPLLKFSHVQIRG